jgi:hypothetical protein
MELTFKELFDFAVREGVGLPANSDGQPIGEWTPKALIAALHALDKAEFLISERTVHNWFGENDKGISREGINYLAEVFGCSEEHEVRSWRLALQDAMSFQKRQRKLERAQSDAECTQKRSLPYLSEKILTQGTTLNFGTGVFAVSMALCMISYFLGVNSIVVEVEEGIEKQIGYMWSPNWTILFLCLFPMFFFSTSNILIFWKEKENTGLVSYTSIAAEVGKTRLESWRFVYWMAAIINFGVVGLAQWIALRALPLTSSNSEFGQDWGSIAITDPNVISVQNSLIFTGLCYAFMCICFFFFTVSVTSICSIIDDFFRKVKLAESTGQKLDRHALDQDLRKIAAAALRCAFYGILIAICMKIQSYYLTSTSTNIISWFRDDFHSFLGTIDVKGAQIHGKRINEFTSLIVVAISCTPLIYGMYRATEIQFAKLKFLNQLPAILPALLAYFFIGMFSGFSIFMLFCLLLSATIIFNPSVWMRRSV